MLNYVFEEASTFIEYDRSQFTLVDVLTEVGSLYNPFYVAGYMCALSFSYNLMMSSIIGKLYAFNARFPDIECKAKEKKKKKKAAKQATVETKNEDSGDDEESDLNQQFKEIKKMYKQE
jgi:hypothetical protein